MLLSGANWQPRMSLEKSSLSEHCRTIFRLETMRTVRNLYPPLEDFANFILL